MGKKALAKKGKGKATAEAPSAKKRQRASASTATTTPTVSDEENEEIEEGNGEDDIVPHPLQHNFRKSAKAAYDKFNAKPWIVESKFMPTAIVQNGNLAHQIETRGWKKLATNHIRPIKEVVLEFLANLHVDPHRNESLVRGVWVSFDPAEINRLYGLTGDPTFNNTEFDRLEQSPNFDEIVTQMCSPGTTWSKPGNINSGSFFSGASLNRVAKAWMLFIASNLLPYTKPHQVTRRRAVLLYCICSGRSINIGRLLNTNIKRVATDGKVLSICHGSLITDLCLRANVPVYVKEVRMALGKDINDTSIEKVVPWAGGREDPNGMGFRDPDPNYPPPLAPIHHGNQAPGPAAERVHAQGKLRRQHRAHVRAVGTTSSSSARPAPEPEDGGYAALAAQMRTMELGYKARFDELHHSNTTVLRSNDALGQSYNSLSAWQAEFGERYILEHNHRQAMDAARIEREMAGRHLHQHDSVPSSSSFTPYPEPPARLSEPFPRYIPYDGPFYTEPQRAAPYPAPFPSPAAYPDMVEPYYGTNSYMPEPPSPFFYHDDGNHSHQHQGMDHDPSGEATRTSWTPPSNMPPPSGWE